MGLAGRTKWSFEQIIDSPRNRGNPDPGSPGSRGGNPGIPGGSSDSASGEWEMVQTHAAGPQGKLPLTEQMLKEWSSGDLFGLSQDVAMGWKPAELLGPEYLILSTQGGVRAEDGRPIALGFHTGHWEVGLLVKAAAEEFKRAGCVPFAAYCSDPCDGRTQGTQGMFDSLAYRNDAAVVLRRLIRSLPTRRGVVGVATCDKGLPAMMLALAGCGNLPGVIVPGGVTLPPTEGEDAGKIQTIGVRVAQGQLSVEEASELGCRACASPGGGCQFLGTAATSQVVAEALGMALPHSALAPSGQPVWLDMAVRSARAVAMLDQAGLAMRDILTEGAIRNAMVVHAAFGGSTNLLLHIPAIAQAAGIWRPGVADWEKVNRAVPRLVDALPNGPVGHPTVRVFLAGGVPEVMLHLREMGLLDLEALTATGQKLSRVLDWWEGSDRRAWMKAELKRRDGVEAQDVIMGPERARQRGLSSTVCFPTGNLAPEGSVIRATSIDRLLLDENGVYLKLGPARVFCTEPAAIAAIKANIVRPGDVLILAGRGPAGAGMEETYQLTSALRYLPWGKDVALITDARFSGVSTGACIGHVGPEALAGGPIGKLRDGDLVRVRIDTRNLTGSIDLVGQGSRTDAGGRSDLEGVELGAAWGEAELARRSMHPDIRPDANLPDDTRLWALLQQASGGTWAGCVYDVERIERVIRAGLRALQTGG